MYISNPPLISVFCSLCQKWVQLRQDSTYCAYPWLQHRGKCLARQYVLFQSPRGFPETHVTFSQRRAEKAAQVAHSKIQKEHLQQFPGHPLPQHSSHPSGHHYSPPPQHHVIAGLKRPHDTDDWVDVKRARILEAIPGDEERAKARSLEETRLAIERLTHHQIEQERELNAISARRHRTESISPLLPRREAPRSGQSPSLSCSSPPVTRRGSLHGPSPDIPRNVFYTSPHLGYTRPILRAVRTDEYDGGDSRSDEMQKPPRLSISPQGTSERQGSTVPGSMDLGESPMSGQRETTPPPLLAECSAPSPPRRDMPSGLADLDSDRGRSVSTVFLDTDPFISHATQQASVHMVIHLPSLLDHIRNNGRAIYLGLEQLSRRSSASGQV